MVTVIILLLELSWSAHPFAKHGLHSSGSASSWVKATTILEAACTLIVQAHRQATTSLASHAATYTC